MCTFSGMARVRSIRVSIVCRDLEYATADSPLLLCLPMTLFRRGVAR